MCPYKRHNVCFCKKNLIDASKGTSHLRRHKSQCEKKLGQERGQTQSQLYFSGNGSLEIFYYSHAKMRERLAIYTAAVEQPFTFGTDVRFERFQKNYVNPQFHVVSRNTVRSDCFKVFTAQKNNLKIELDTYKATIACTSNMWQGRNYLHYYILTAQ